MDQKIRWEKVNQIRRQLERGEYDEKEDRKMEVVIARVLEVLEK